MSIRVPRIPVGLRLALAAALLPALAAQESPSPLQPRDILHVSPPGSLVVLSVPPVDATWKAFQETALYRLYCSDEIQALVETLMDLSSEQLSQQGLDPEEPLSEVEEFTGHTQEELIEVLEQAGFGLALVDVDPSGEVLPDVILALDAGAHAARATDVVEKVVQKLVEEDDTVARTAARHLDHPYASLSDGEVTLCYAWVGDTLYVTLGENRMRAVLAACAPDVEGPSVATSAAYTAGRRPAGPEAVAAEVYVDVAALLELADPELDDESRRVLSLLGVSGIQSVSATFGITPPGMRDRVYIHAPGARRGITRILTLAPVDPALAGRVPASAVSFTAFSLDLAAVWTEVQSVLEELLPPEENDEMRKAIEHLEVELEVTLDEFLASVGARWWAWTEPLAAEGPQRQALRVELKDPAAFQKGLDALYSLDEEDVIRRETIGDTPVAVIPLGEELGQELPPDMPEGLARLAQPPDLYLFLYEGTFCMVSGRDLAQRILEGKVTEQGSLADSAAYQQAAKDLLPGAGVISYTDLDGWVDTMADAVGPFVEELLQSPDSPLGPDFKLPPRQLFKDHLFPWVTSFAADKDGFTLGAAGPVAAIPLVAAVAAAGAALVVPMAMAAEPGGSALGVDAERLRSLGLAVQMYTLDNDGKYPANLEMLVMAGNVSAEQLEGITYIYAPGLEESEEPSRTVLAHADNLGGAPTRAVLFLDGHVELLSELEFLELRADQMARQSGQATPASDAPLSPQEATRLQALVQRLGDPDALVAMQAQEAIKLEFGTRAVPYLKQAVEDPATDPLAAAMTELVLEELDPDWSPDDR